MEFNRGSIRIVEKTVPPAKDPLLTLEITAPVSEWKAVVRDLGSGTQKDSKSSFAFFDVLDDAVKANS